MDKPLTIRTIAENSNSTLDKIVNKNLYKRRLKQHNDNITSYNTASDNSGSDTDDETYYKRQKQLYQMKNKIKQYNNEHNNQQHIDSTIEQKTTVTEQSVDDNLLNDSNDSINNNHLHHKYVAGDEMHDEHFDEAAWLNELDDSNNNNTNLDNDDNDNIDEDVFEDVDNSTIDQQQQDDKLIDRPTSATSSNGIVDNGFSIDLDTLNTSNDSMDSNNVQHSKIRRKINQLTGQQIRNSKRCTLLFTLVRGIQASQLSDVQEIKATMLSLLPNKLQNIKTVKLQSNDNNNSKRNDNKTNKTNATTTQSVDIANIDKSYTKDLVQWFTSTFKCNNRSGELLVHCSKSPQRIFDCAIEQLLYAIEIKQGNGQICNILFTALCKSLNIPIRIIHCFPEFIRLPDEYEDNIDSSNKQPRTNSIKHKLYQLLHHPPKCQCEKIHQLHHNNNTNSNKTNNNTDVFLISDSDNDSVVEVIDLSQYAYKPIQQRNTRPPFPLDYVFEPLRVHSDYYQRSLFGMEAVYIGTKQSLVAGCKQEPWNGILIPTDRQYHASLINQFPALKAHTKLGKWLYISVNHLQFRTVTKQITDLILQNDQRIGVQSTATLDKTLTNRLQQVQKTTQDRLAPAAFYKQNNKGKRKSKKNSHNTIESQATEILSGADNHEISNTASSTNTNSSKPTATNGTGKPKRQRKTKSTNNTESQATEILSDTDTTNTTTTSTSKTDNVADIDSDDSDIIDITPAKQTKPVPSKRKRKHQRRLAIKQAKIKVVADMQEMQQSQSSTTLSAELLAEQKKIQEYNNVLEQAASKRQKSDTVVAASRRLKRTLSNASNTSSNDKQTTSHNNMNNIDDDDCHICGSGKSGSNNAILLCDECDLGYHMKCLVPPLYDIPDGNWYCHNCTSKHVEPATDHSIQPHDKRNTKDSKNSTSSKTNNNNNHKQSSICNWWVEIYSYSGKRWLYVDICRSIIDDTKSVELHVPCKLTYCIAYRTLYNKIQYMSSNYAHILYGKPNQCIITDVTKRYTTQWMKVSNRRIDDKWWLQCIEQVSDTIEPYMKHIEQDDYNVLQRVIENESIPTTLNELKNHPLYITDIHLKKFEYIYPNDDSCVVGTIESKDGLHKIYRRSNLHTLHTADRWTRELRRVKPGEQPIKQVNAMKYVAAKRDDPHTYLYGIWQTETIQPDVAHNGVVPLNERGHVDLWTDQHLPIGTTHLKYPRLQPICKKLDIHYGIAMVGFDIRGGRSVPKFEGIVVCNEYVDTVMAAYREQELIASERRSQKRLDNIYKCWFKLMRSVIIKQRVINDLNNKGITDEYIIHQTKQQINERNKLDEFKKLNRQRKKDNSDGINVVDIELQDYEKQQEQNNIIEQLDLDQPVSVSVSVNHNDSVIDSTVSNNDSSLRYNDDHIHVFDQTRLNTKTNAWDYYCICGLQNTEEH